MNKMHSASKGLEIHEPSIFERSTQLKSGVDFDAENDGLNSDDPQLKAMLCDHFVPNRTLCLPSVSEPDAVRHFTRLSKKNFAIDTSSYPLGSCTMKYNPKINEWAARLSGISELHPYMDEKDLQHALKICYELQNYLSEIGGFYKTSLAPAAGAQGEFSGIAMIQKALKKRGETRTHILVPDSAHGTNPATAAFFSLDVKSIPMDEFGRLKKSDVEGAMNDLVAGVMITNPNTLGIYEDELYEIAKIVHERGGFVYGDGANLNALMGKVRPHDIGIDVMHFNLHKTMTTPHGGGGPGCGAVGASKSLAPFLPTPFIKKNTDDSYELVWHTNDSMGPVRSFVGNFGMMIRAWTYIRSLGAQGLKESSNMAVLNANYIRKKLEPYYEIPIKSPCLHEVVLSDALQKKHGICALDIAKRLLDYGIHPPTMYFPLVVSGALMIEPTESESLFDLDRMIDAFITIAKEAQNEPELVKSAPHNCALKRVNETHAARNPILTYQSFVKNNQ